MSKSPDNPQDHESAGPSVTQPPTGAPHDESRRRLIRGAAASPVIFTLASRPAWGGVCTVSVMASDNLSHPGRTDDCRGCTPGFWGQHPDWPDPYEPGNCTENSNHGNSVNSASGCQEYDSSGTKFNAVFGMAHPAGDHITMMQVIHLNGNGDPYQLGAHACAAVLNAAYWGPDIFGYTPDEIVHMYYTRAYSDPEALKYELEMLNTRGCLG